MLIKVLCVILPVFFAVRAQFVIERGERDIFRNLTSCSASTTSTDYCYGFNAEESPYDKCVCRCKEKYPMYRNPDARPSGGVFVSKGKPSCVWHSYHRYECFHIRRLGTGVNASKDERALNFNFQKPGNLTVYSDQDVESCSFLETAIKFPDETEFTIKNGLLNFTRVNIDRILLQWNTIDAKYDGGLIRGVFRDCQRLPTIKESGRCFVGKISGVYNGNCSIRTVDGKCCIFPFTYKGETYNNCTTVDNARPWCAVRLPFFNNESNWRQNCSNSSQATATPSLSSSPTPSNSSQVTATPSLSSSPTPSVLPTSLVPSTTPAVKLEPTPSEGVPPESEAVPPRTGEKESGSSDYLPTVPIVVGVVVCLVILVVCGVCTVLRKRKQKEKTYSALGLTRGQSPKEMTQQTKEEPEMQIEQPRQDDIVQIEDVEPQDAETEFTIPDKPFIVDKPEDQPRRNIERIPTFLTFKL